MAPTPFDLWQAPLVLHQKTNPVFEACTPDLLLVSGKPACAEHEATFLPDTSECFPTTVVGSTA